MNRENYSVERICKVLKVSRSCYYRWFTGNISKREFENQRLRRVIKQVFIESKGRYGSPRITAELKRQGYYVSKPRVAKLMRQQGLRSKLKKKFKITTDSNHSYLISENHLSRDFKPKTLYEVWVSKSLTSKQGKDGCI